MDFVVDRLPQGKKLLLKVTTRIMVILLFIFIGVNLFMLGREYYVSHEVSQTIRMPIYPFVYAVGLVCFVECYVIFCDILRVLGGDHEEVDTMKMKSRITMMHRVTLRRSFLPSELSRRQENP